MRIFGTYAPLYWERGLSVVPLRPQQKRPIPEGWSDFATQLPSPEVQEQWLKAYPDGNIGLVLGPQSNIMVIDIDSDDPGVKNAIERLLPPTPWVRVGKKGAVHAFRYNGVSTFRIKNQSGNTLVECLSTGTQVVLPPSIHPETKLPYYANADLLDVVDQLPILPVDIEKRLRDALVMEGVSLSISGWTKVTEFVPLGARDSAMTAFAGVLARGVTRGERRLVEVLDEMRVWVEEKIEKANGDDIDPRKGQQQIINFLMRDVLGKRRTLPKGWDSGLTEEDKKKLGLTFGEEHEQWSFASLQKHLQIEFEQHPIGSDARHAAINEVLSRIAYSSHENTVEQEMILGWISQSAGVRLPVSALRKRLNELRQGEIQGKDHTEIAKAVLVDLNQYGEVRWWDGSFWQWNGTHWEKMPDTKVLVTIADEYGHYEAAKRHNEHKGIIATMRLLAERPLKEQITVEAVNFGNGVLTSDLKLVPHHPSYGMTYRLPYKWNPEGEDTCFRFQEMLRQAWGEDSDFEEKKQALRQMIATTLFGQAWRYQRCFCLYGPGGTGKSALMDVIRNLVPDEGVCSVPPSDWGDKFKPATMVGARLNMCGELSETKLIDGDMFKQIVGGEEMNAQHKNQPIFTFKPVCAHWFATNHLPKTRDSSSGFSRRWLILEFRKKVRLEDRVLGIGMQIAAEEREAIVAWAIKSIVDLEAQREYTLPVSHQRLIKEVAATNNNVRAFVEFCKQVVIDPSKTVYEGELHTAYQTYCLSTSSGRVDAPQAFRHKMRELASEYDFKIEMMSKQGTTIPVYHGIGIQR